MVTASNSPQGAECHFCPPRESSVSFPELHGEPHSAHPSAKEDDRPITELSSARLGPRQLQKARAALTVDFSIHLALSVLSLISPGILYSTSDGLIGQHPQHHGLLLETSSSASVSPEPP
jgi:hypothetical protein